MDPTLGSGEAMRPGHIDEAVDMIEGTIRLNSFREHNRQRELPQPWKDTASNRANG